MKLKIIPKSTVDRMNAIISFICTLVIALAVIKAAYLVALLLAMPTIGLLILTYGFPTQVEGSASANEYLTVIEKISAMGKQLSDLNGFLEKERTRVANIEATVRSLNDEKTKLEPVVSTQRETVEAILAAHSERTARQAWKERLLGFALGVVASLIASFVYGYFNQ